LGRYAIAPTPWELAATNRSALCAAALIALGFSANAAFATPVPYSDKFNGLTTTELLTPPPGWISSNGTVDSVKNGDYGISCFEGKGGCVELDGNRGLILDKDDWRYHDRDDWRYHDKDDWWYHDKDDFKAVPLPAAAWLMLSGLAALGGVARRRITGASA
jgi:hypothetical protein